jgi:hypothetical protein
MHVLHAGAVELDGAVVAVIGHSGGGKSTLIGELLKRGALLFADDVLALDPELTAHPGPPLMNVAAERSDLIALGRTLATLHEGDDEAWVAIERASRAPRRLAALFLYQRGPGLALASRPLQPTVLELVPYAWVIPDDREAMERRFGLLAEVAVRVPVFTLTAGLDRGPAEIADALHGSVRNLD